MQIDNKKVYEMLKIYRTVKGCGQKEIEINKSRFIAYVEQIENEEAAISFIEQIKKKHWKSLAQ